ncbi:uncharacterized protein LOC134753796 [Cydia strobilella]|uniref:uncharacterized protein LOC134753796 n=1 Tax=Cydia strobilella TaxID=1100964 RepID=UPI003006A8F4
MACSCAGGEYSFWVIASVKKTTQHLVVRHAERDPEREPEYADKPEQSTLAQTYKEARPQINWEEGQAKKKKLNKEMKPFLFFTASDPGVVVLRPEALTRDSDSDETDDCGPPSPLAVHFINDNVLINGRSSMPGKVDRSRAARLKIQFDDSLTRTFEYPSETSLCEDSPQSSAQPPQPAHQAALGSNTHIVYSRRVVVLRLAPAIPDETFV